MKRSTALIFSFIVFATACTKIKTTDIGSGLIPPVDGVLTKDTIIDVTAKNADTESVRVGLGEDHVLGYLNDPLFGKTYAKINLQLTPAFFPYSFEVHKDSLHLDSVVLVLGYDASARGGGVYGDSTQDIALRAYELQLNQEFKPDSVYLNTVDFATSGEVTENNTAKIVDVRKLKDSVYYFQDSGINQIRIRLNLSIGQKFLNFDSTNAYRSDSAFRVAFKGFQIAPDSGVGNSLLKINLLDANTKLALYYKYDRRDSAGKQTAAVKYFTVKSNLTTAHSNYIHRDYSGSQADSYFKTPNAKDSLLFIQTGPGIYANIKIDDGISSFPNVIVHRAELIVDQVPDQTFLSDQTFPPGYLFLSGYSEDSSRRFALYPDVQFSSNSGSNYSTFGSIPFKQVDNSNGGSYYTYHFNITRYIQNLLTHQTKNYPLVLYGAYNQYLYQAENSTFTAPISYPDPLNTVASGRVRVAGGSINNPHKMRLHIIYSLVQ